jgi:surface-anchored protein
LTLVSLFAVCSARAQFNDILTQGEVEVGIEYTNDEGWNLHIHDHTNELEYSPDTTLLYVKDQARATRPGGSQWDFLGVGAGEDVWVLPQTENPDLLFMGIASEEMSGDTFDSYFESDSRINADGRWITLSLADMRGPGAFSVWTNDSFGDPVVWMASSDGISAMDKTITLEGGHDHLNWGFTKTGLYEVDLVASAYLGGSLISSNVTTYHFGVETVPEPASMLALGGGLIVLSRRRRR